MAITGNKGEWSEIYAFLRLLADGKLFAADEQLNRIQEVFFPIIKIIRQETLGTPYEYRSNDTEVEVYLDGRQVLHLPTTRFGDEADLLLDEINAHSKGSGAFEVARTESFIRGIHVNRLKAPSSDKSDITIQIHDINTGFKNIVGFSIKSELGMPPTLLNAAGTTNLIYKVDGLDKRHIAQINSIETRRKIRDRITAISDYNGKLVFRNTESPEFNDNLIMIDSQMPSIVAEMLIGYYSGVATECAELVRYVSQKDPLSLSVDFYRHKVKEMLCAVALGMKPATKWDGTDEASGGYIIVRRNGDVLAYHIYNRNAFRSYLLNNTKFESASSDRHGYGLLYDESGEIRIKLNLQVRFV